MLHPPRPTFIGLQRSRKVLARIRIIKSLFEDSADLIESTALLHGSTRMDSIASSYLSKIAYHLLSYPSIQQPLPLAGHNLPLLLLFVEIGDTQAVSPKASLLMIALKKKLESSKNSHSMQSGETCNFKLSEQKSCKETGENNRSGHEKSFYNR